MEDGDVSLGSLGSPNRTLVLVLLLGYIAAVGVFITCAKHLQHIVSVTRRIDSRLSTIDYWLDSAIQESSPKP